MLQNLSALCLETIVDHFRRFNLAFTTSQDDNMKRNLEFLQRKYSFDLLTSLMTKDGSVENDYIDFLINKHLKVLDAAWFRNCTSWEKVTSKIAEIGSNIEKILLQDLYFDEYTEETPWQDIIHFLPNLKSFTYQDDCNYLILKNVAKFCPNIEEMDFQNSAVEFEDMKNFCKNENGKSFCTKLKKLCFAGSNIREDGVKYFLKNFPSLEVIDYPELPLLLYSLHKNDLSSLDKLEPYNIASLNLINCAHSPFFADIIKVCLSVCPRLKSLTFGFVNKDNLNSFPNLSDLEQLYIENFCDSEVNINNFLKSKGRKLIYLTVINCAVSVTVLAASCPRIKELVLNRVNLFGDDDLKPTFSSLSSCAFECTDVATSNKIIGLLLSSSSKLESLSFKRCSLSPEIKAHILRCCEHYPVKRISFCCSVVDKEYIKDLLLNCHTLNYLNIDGCFDSDDEDELIRFAEILSNKPEIDASDHLDNSDYEEYINGNYEFDDYDNEYDYDFEDYDDYEEYDYEYDSDEGDI